MIRWGGMYAPGQWHGRLLIQSEARWNGLADLRRVGLVYVLVARGLSESAARRRQDTATAALAQDETQ